MLKLIQDCFDFAENSRQPLNKSNTKLRAIWAWSFTFSRAFLTLNFYWLWAFPIECQKKPGLGWLSFTSLCDWSRNLTSASPPIRYKTKPIRDVITLFFPPLKKFALRALYLTVFVSFAFSHNCPICGLSLYGQLPQ